MEGIKEIIIAAGKGTRIYDPANPSPKVLKEADGRPLLAYVIDSTSLCGIKRSDITIVVGFMHEMVEEKFRDWGCGFALQGDKAYGTGYAVMCGMEAGGLYDFDGTVLVLQGDVPLVKPETVRAMLDEHLKAKNSCTLLSCVTEKKLPFGRIVRENGRLTAIVEQKDATPEQKLIRELNVGLYIFDCKKLAGALSRLDCKNEAGEYYLTDVPSLLLGDGERVDAFITRDETELWGVNTLEDLKIVGDILRSRKNPE